METDNIIGSSIMYLSLYGTAVKVITEEEYASSVEQRKKEEEISRIKNEERMQRLENERLRKTNGDISKEIDFIRKMRGMDSMIKIWDLWRKSGFGNDFIELDKDIRRLQNSERLYGRIHKDTEAIKNRIEKALIGDIE